MTLNCYVLNTQSNKTLEKCPRKEPKTIFSSDTPSLGNFRLNTYGQFHEGSDDTLTCNLSTLLIWRACHSNVVRTVTLVSKVQVILFRLCHFVQ